MNAVKVVAGVLAGFAAGALAGVLFAPAKGSKTRRRILRKGEKYADDLKEKFDDLKEEVSNRFEKVKEHATKFTDEKNKSAKGATA